MKWMYCTLYMGGALRNLQKAPPMLLLFPPLVALRDRNNEGGEIKRYLEQGVVGVQSANSIAYCITSVYGPLRVRPLLR